MHRWPQTYWNIIRGRVLLLLLLLSGISPYVAADPCEKISEAAEGIIHPAASFEQWQNFSDLANKLRPDHLFPEAFLQEMKFRFNEVKITESPLPDKNQRFGGLTIAVVADGRRFAKFNLFQRKDVPGAVEVDGLVLRNHLVDAQGKKLAADQAHPGLPPEVFRFAFNGVLNILKNGPFTQIYVESSQHFGVAQLYARVSGFRPYNQQTEANFTMLEQYRKLARTWPEEIRIRSVDALVAAIGAFGVSARDARMDRIWQEFLTSGSTPAGVEIIRHSDNLPYAIVLRENGQVTVRFVNQLSPQRELFDWRTMCSSGYCRMIRDIR